MIFAKIKTYHGPAEVDGILAPSEIALVVDRPPAVEGGEHTIGITLKNSGQIVTVKGTLSEFHERMREMTIQAMADQQKAQRIVAQQQREALENSSSGLLIPR